MLYGSTWTGMIGKAKLGKYHRFYQRQENALYFRSRGEFVPDGSLRCSSCIPEKPMHMHGTKCRKQKVKQVQKNILTPKNRLVLEVGGRVFGENTLDFRWCVWEKKKKSAAKFLLLDVKETNLPTLHKYVFCGVQDKSFHRFWLTRYIAAQFSFPLSLFGSVPCQLV